MGRSKLIVQIDVLESRRLLSVGQLDTTFGTAGSSAVNQSFPNFYQRAEVVQADGKILLGGEDNTASNGTTAAIVRLNADGSIDKSFGKNGEATFVYGPNSDNDGILQMALQPDGKVLAVGGEAFKTSSYEFAGIARLNPDGTLDTSFNGKGTVEYGATNAETAFNIVKVMSDGRILVGGQAYGGQVYGATDFLIARFKGDGTLDTTLNGGGIKWVDMGGQDALSDLNITSSSEIIATGYMQDFGKFAAVEITSSGVIDRSFGSNGRRYDSNFMPLTGGTFLEANGTFIVAGTNLKTQAPELHDYSANGSETGFGLVTFDATDLRSATMEPDGKIILAAVLYQTTGLSDILLRVDPNGTLDTTFGDNGQATLDSTDDSIEAMSITPDGGIVVGIEKYGALSTILKLQGDSGWAVAPDVPGPGVSLGSDGMLTVTGTTANDNITIANISGNVVVDRNGTQSTFASSSIKALIIDGLDGNDAIASSLAINSTIDGGAGNDVIHSGNGNDVIHGGDGNDIIFGNGGNDQITGDAGKDSLHGGDGNDTIDGGSSSDHLYGDAGADVLMGEGGNDHFYAADSTADTIFGGSGTDYATCDAIDDLSSITYRL